ncbi:hypothetical protein ACFTUC_15020 [Streptomyces sp. NPDC056944]|uniref:hypothetical protein n=1 Tax=Streptomyces sp. NPDC056944 TaxID=3345972 RepID=UPI00362F31C2
MEFLVLQEQDRTEHVATEKELAEAKKNSWTRIPRFDYTPSECLRFVLRGGQPHRASEWADTPARSLEDQLAEIAQEIALRGEAAERRRLNEIEAARQKRVRWEAAMEEAHIQYAEAYRFRHFETQEAAWRHATGLAEYVSAVRTRVDAMPPGQTRTEAETCIDWAAARVERLDPLNTPPRLPDIPEPRADDLRPFFGHWSTSGPWHNTDRTPQLASRNVTTEKRMRQGGQQLSSQRPGHPSAPKSRQRRAPLGGRQPA